MGGKGKGCSWLSFFGGKREKLTWILVYWCTLFFSKLKRTPSMSSLNVSPPPPFSFRVKTKGVCIIRFAHCHSPFKIFNIFFFSQTSSYKCIFTYASFLVAFHKFLLLCFHSLFIYLLRIYKFLVLFIHYLSICLEFTSFLVLFIHYLSICSEFTSVNAIREPSQIKNFCQESR